MLVLTDREHITEGIKGAREKETRWDRKHRFIRGCLRDAGLVTLAGSLVQGLFSTPPNEVLIWSSMALGGVALVGAYRMEVWTGE